jgi:hypothetical protein
VYEEDGEHEIIPKELDDLELTETEEEHRHREVLITREVYAPVEEQVGTRTSDLDCSRAILYVLMSLCL